MTTQNLQTSDSTIKTPGEIIAEKIGNVITKNLLTLGKEVYAPADQDFAVAAWFELFKAAGVPSGGINRCYLAAKLYRADLLARGEYAPPMSAELVVAMYAMRVRAEMDAENPLKRLANGLIHDCRQCFGTGFIHSGWNDSSMRLRDMFKTKTVCSHLDADGKPTFDADGEPGDLSQFAAEFDFETKPQGSGSAGK